MRAHTVTDLALSLDAVVREIDEAINGGGMNVGDVAALTMVKDAVRRFQDRVRGEAVE